MVVEIPDVEFHSIVSQGQIAKNETGYALPVTLGGSWSAATNSSDEARSGRSAHKALKIGPKNTSLNPFPAPPEQRWRPLLHLP